MGMWRMATQAYDLYPEATRQFLATCEVVYQSDNIRRMDRAKLAFFYEGKRYTIFLADLCTIYGFDEDPSRVAVDSSQLSLRPFWDTIAQGQYAGGMCRTSRIRNPVLRVAAKVLGNTLFCREEPDKCRQEELFFLLTGLPEELQTQVGLAETFPFRPPNLAGVFAEVLKERKYRALGKHARAKVDSIGSLLTPIFEHCRLPLQDAATVSRAARIDRAYMEHAHIFAEGLYRWIGGDANAVSYCRLPKPAYAGVQTLDQIRFLLPRAEMCGESGAPLPDAVEPDAPAPHRRQVRQSRRRDPLCAHRERYGPPEYVTEDLPPSFYEMAELPEDAPAYARQIYEVQGRQMSLFRRILSGLSRIQWRPPPACCSRPGDVTDPQPSTAATAAAADDDEDEDETSDEETTAQESSEGTGSSGARYHARARYDSPDQ